MNVDIGMTVGDWKTAVAAVVDGAEAAAVGRPQLPGLEPWVGWAPASPA